PACLICGSRTPALHGLFERLDDRNRLRLCRSGPQWQVRLFSPAGGKRRHSSRNKKGRPLPSSSFACGPSAAAAAVPVMSQAIEAMKGMVSEQGKDINMATIGTFKK